MVNSSSPSCSPSSSSSSSSTSSSSPDSPQEDPRGGTGEDEGAIAIAADLAVAAAAAAAVPVPADDHHDHDHADHAGEAEAAAAEAGDAGDVDADADDGDGSDDDDEHVFRIFRSRTQDALGFAPPPGPSSLQEAFEWPKKYANKMVSDPECLQSFCKLIRQGVRFEVHDSFAGMGTGSVTFKQSLIALVQSANEELSKQGRSLLGRIWC